MATNKIVPKPDLLLKHQVHALARESYVLVQVEDGQLRFRLQYREPATNTTPAKPPGFITIDITEAQLQTLLSLGETLMRS